ncbi:MAG: hypothetical protein J6K41_09765 [Paraprevotella sp.]|nr:hypothetical protein [Paraprevotella sp.]
MVKLIKRSLDELAMEMPVLSEHELRMCIGGTGAVTRYSESKFWKLYSSGQWEGGVVNGWGNLDANIAVAQYSDLVDPSYFMDGYVWASGCLWHDGVNFNGDQLFGGAFGDSGNIMDSGLFDDFGSGEESEEEDRNKRLINYSSSFSGTVTPVFPIPDIGIRGIYNYEGNVSIVDNEATVSVTIKNPALRGSDTTYTGAVELYVNGAETGCHTFSWPSNGLIYETGDIPLGNCHFTIPTEGRIEIKVRVGRNYNTGTGNIPTNGSQTIYKSEP